MITPWMIYLIGILDNLIVLFKLLCGICFILGAVAVVMLVDDGYEEIACKVITASYFMMFSAEEAKKHTQLRIIRHWR